MSSRWAHPAANGCCCCRTWGVRTVITPALPARPPACSNMHKIMRQQCHTCFKFRMDREEVRARVCGPRRHACLHLGCSRARGSWGAAVECWQALLWPAAAALAVHAPAAALLLVQARKRQAGTRAMAAHAPSSSAAKAAPPAALRSRSTLPLFCAWPQVERFERKLTLLASGRLTDAAAMHVARGTVVRACGRA